MALSKIAKFDWDKLLAKAHSPDVERAVKQLRAKSNEVTSNSAVYVKAPSSIDFKAYKLRLKFTADAVDKLETAYKSASTPTYTATLPAFESKKRELLLSVVKSTVAAAEADLASLKAQLDSFEETRFTRESTIGDAMKKFPDIAKEVEEEIKNHEWTK